MDADPSDIPVEVLDAEDPLAVAPVSAESDPLEAVEPESVSPLEGPVGPKPGESLVSSFPAQASNVANQKMGNVILCFMVLASWLVRQR